MDARVPQDGHSILLIDETAKLDRNVGEAARDAREMLTTDGGGSIGERSMVLSDVSVALGSLCRQRGVAIEVPLYTRSARTSVAASVWTVPPTLKTLEEVAEGSLEIASPAGSYTTEELSCLADVVSLGDTVVEDVVALLLNLLIRCSPRNSMMAGKQIWPSFLLT